VRAVVQRVSQASVSVDQQTISSIGTGLLILVGAAGDDNEDSARALSQKIAKLRIFPDANNKMNRSLLDIGGSALVVSQFTLLADLRRGNRPSFVGAARPGVAEPLIEVFSEELETLGIDVEHGRFGASMQIAIVNDGPVTIVLDS
jgi:D-tyrosyl-tRNA(Tyr) deacylase